MRNGLLAVLLCAAVALLAVGASAAVVVSKTWAVRRGESTLAEVRETPSGVSLRDWTDKFAERELTKDEAASLGRALLEAAGQPEKVCPASPSCSSIYGCLTITPNLQAIPTGYMGAP